MVKKIIVLSCVTFLVSFQGVFAASSLDVSFTPPQVIQGEPVMITVNGTSTLTGIKKVTLNGETLSLFLYKKLPRALYGIDIQKKPGDYIVTVTLKDGTVITKNLVVNTRPKVEAALGIPESLGGNTVASEKKLVSTLLLENQNLAKLWSNPKSLWTSTFQYPTQNPIVTDEYGYSRLTGASTITHKGTDFRATTGTKIYAMNRGVVRQAKTYRNYGKTVVIDHGQGVMTFYMHLSKINVKEGQLVSKGQIIGLSGKTGYAESPHLHLTIRINGVSIDPVKFIELFK